MILGSEQFHLLDGNFVQTREAVGLAQSLADEDGVEIFQIRKADQLGAGGLVADVAFVFRVRGTPLGRGLPEEGHVEHVGFAGIDEAGLRFAQLRRDEVGLDSVSVDAVVDLGEVAADVPADAIHVDEAIVILDRDFGAKLCLIICLSPDYGARAGHRQNHDPVINAAFSSVIHFLLLTVQFACKEKISI